MKKQRNNLDEQQEQKLLKIEHTGCWLAFWGLWAAVVVELILFGKEGFGRIAGEWIVFMVLALYLGLACIKKRNLGSAAAAHTRDKSGGFADCWCGSRADYIYGCPGAASGLSQGRFSQRRYCASGDFYPVYGGTDNCLRCL